MEYGEKNVLFTQFYLLITYLFIARDKQHHLLDHLLCGLEFFLGVTGKNILISSIGGHM